MRKRVTAFELMLPARDPEAPAYRWIYAALRTEILEGRLRPAVVLPSSRDLAFQYRLSRRGRLQRAGLQLGFAATSPNEIRRGVRELGIALEGVIKGHV